jgi:hypothetical protein
MVGPFRAAAAQAEVLLAAALCVLHRVLKEAVRTMFGEVQRCSILRRLQEEWDADAQEAARKMLIDMRDEITLSCHRNDRTRILKAVESL